MPTHYYKVVLADGRKGGDGQLKAIGVGAFVMPNAPIDPKLPLTVYVVPLQDLEVSVRGRWLGAAALLLVPLLVCNAWATPTSACMQR